MDKSLLIDRLGVALIGLVSLKQSETDATRKKELNKIANDLLLVIDMLRDDDNLDRAKVAWKAVEEAVIKFGVKEIVELILELL